MSEDVKQEANGLNVKAEVLRKFLEENKIEGFMTQVVKDSMNSVVFRSNIEVEGQQLPFMIVLDDSVYSLLQIQVVGTLLKERRDEISLYLNDLNEAYRMLKYTVNEDGDLLLSVCIITGNENFAPQLVLAVLDEVISHLRQTYPAIMKEVWARR